MRKKLTMTKIQKSILGAALLVAFEGASAATLYKKGDVEWKLKGDFQVQLRRKAGENEDSFVDYDDAEIKNSITYSLDNGAKLFAQVDYDIKKEETEEVYVGMDFGNFTFLIGQTDLPSKDFGHEKAWEGSSFEDTFEETAEESDNQIQLRTQFAGWEFSIARDIEDAEFDDAGDLVKPKVLIDAFLYKEYAGFDFGFAYQELDAEFGSDSINTFGVGVGTSFGPVEVGLDYSENDSLEVLALVTEFSVAPKTNLVASYEVAEEDGVDINSWYMSLNHKIHDKITLLGELSNTDEDGSDVAYVLGMRVKF